jgi:hypothetical protein
MRRKWLVRDAVQECKQATTAVVLGIGTSKVVTTSNLRRCRTGVLLATIMPFPCHILAADGGLQRRQQLHAKMEDGSMLLESIAS